VTSPKWPALSAGTELRIVQPAPDGREVTNYPGRVIDFDAPAPWVVARAEWVLKTIELDGLRFVPGDRLHEFFSPAHPFNVFSIWSPDGALRGWYANVTHPARLDLVTDPISLFWHDLYIDVIARPDGTVTVRDVEELVEAGLASSDPDLHALIHRAREELLRLFTDRAFPFHEFSDPEIT
jgi:Protein of unknown function (DUF402)